MIRDEVDKMDLLGGEQPMIVGFPHPPPRRGGPGTFQTLIEKALEKKGWKVVYPQDGVTPDVIFLVGGTKKIGWLWRNKRRGVPIVVRLAGLNWLHRIVRVGIKEYLLNVVRNIVLRSIRRFFADAVVYQSEFAANWWRKDCGGSVKNEAIIHNAVDLDQFKPERSLPAPPRYLLCAEGTVDYSPYAVDLINYLSDQLNKSSNCKGVLVFGGFQNPALIHKLNPGIDYRGRVEREKMSSVYKNAVYLSLDVNATCPNAVIEALASGIPVIGLDTGALKEIVPLEAGLVVDYGANPWKGEKPKMASLLDAAQKVLEDWGKYAQGARNFAEKNYDVKDMTDRYISILQDEIKKSRDR